MNLKQLILELKTAVQAGHWFDVARLAAKLLAAGADLAELVIGTAEDVSGELNELQKVCQETVVKADAGAAIDPATVLQIVFLVIDLIRKAKQK